jgi:hypothetical protein
MTKFAKGDQVRVRATKFDGEGERDELGLTFSEKWLRDGNGEWCYGKISFVYRKKSREAQKYRILYHEGTSMESLEGDIEMAPEDDEDSVSETEEEKAMTIDELEGEGDDDRHPQDRGEEDSDYEGPDDGNVELQSDEDENQRADETVTVGGVQYPIFGKRKRETEWQGSEGEILMGDIVKAGEYTWERIEQIDEDCREEAHFDTTFKTNLFNNDATEVDVFWAFMPLQRSTLLEIVRVNADEDGDKRIWLPWHVDATLALIFGGAQFKEGTDLWSTKKVGMLPAPDFGRQLSNDRFRRVVRYWARGLPEERDKLKRNPWAQIDPWVKGFNEARNREIKPGSSVTPDESMFEWKGKSGFGGLPHLSLIIRKPEPLGTESKTMCEGTFGICIHLEIQKGKIRMARKKFVTQYGATTGCTVRLCNSSNLSEEHEVPPLARCVYADSWFASLKTVLALRTELGLNFTGPIKTATTNFPIEAMRCTLSKLKRGDHIVLKCVELPNVWAVGWHDHHYKCYITTHGVTTPGKPAPKRRQDIAGTNYTREIPRPHIIAKYQDEMGYVDRHNNFRQGTLKLAKTWKTKRWQTRIQLELLGTTIVDAFLACRKVMPKYRDLDDTDSIFWKFVCAVIGQIDHRPISERVREGEDENPTVHCKHVPIGQYRVSTGTYKGSLKSKQSRCKYCPLRRRADDESGTSPPTCFCCSFHDVAICKKYNCWQLHLNEVERNAQDEFAI